jgi:tetratricopeptide (TPR) repeat protein
MRRYRTEVVVCVALLLLTAGAFGHVCRNNFVNYDDNDYVVRNPDVKAGLSAAGATWAFTTTRASNWHPLTWLSLQLDAQLYGGDVAWGYHLTNLLLHAAAALVLFLALRRMTGAVGRSAVVAALFAVHPAHVESVAWVAERKDVLSGLLWMLTLLAYAWYAERPGVGRYLLVLLAFALGLLAKPMLVTLPFVLLLLDYWPLGRVGAPFSRERPASAGPALAGRSRLNVLLEKLPLFALTAAACLVTVYAQEKGGAVNSLERLALRERLINCVVAYADYLGKLVWPAALVPFYPHPRESLSLGQAVRDGLVLILITAGVVWARRRRYLTVGWLWFLGTLVPVIGLVQVGAQAMADRYTYVPYVGLFIALTWGAADLAARWPAVVPSAAVPLALLVGIWKPLGLWLALGAGAEVMADRLLFVPVAGLSAVAVVGWLAGRLAGLWPARVSLLAPAVALLLGACVAFTAWQVRLWQNPIWLWEYTVQRTKDNWLAHNNLGDAYWNSRHPQRVERARANFLEALRVSPRHAKARNNLGLIYFSERQLAEAAEQFRQAAEIDPQLTVALLNWGAVLTRQGKFAEAIEQEQRALRLDPASAAARAYLGQALAGAGRWEEAAGAFARAVELEPKDPHCRADLGWALCHLGRPDEARAEFARVLALDGGWAEWARGTAWTWATDPHPGRRCGWEAVRLAEQAWLAGGGCDPRALEALAAAYAEARCCVGVAACRVRQALLCAGADPALHY